MKTKKLTSKKNQPRRKFAVWHSDASPEIVEGISVVVTHDRITIDQGNGKSRVILGNIMVTEPTEKIKFL
jgi:hypothetical protein